MTALLSVLGYLAVAAVSAVAGYWAMFSSFANYDDSGFFIYSIRQFIDGHTLYDRVFTDYGPFSYELWGGVFDLSGRSLTTDSARVAVLALWVVIPLLLGVSAQRLTRRLSIGLIVQVLAFNLLAVFTLEPMHATAVVCLLFAFIMVICAFGLTAYRDVSLVGLGAIVGALLLTKVNVGGFALIAILFSVVVALPGLWRLGALRWAAAAVFVAVGPLLMSADLDRTPTLRFAVLAAAGAASVALIAFQAPERGTDDRAEARIWATRLLGGFAGAVVVLLGIVFILGSSPSDLYHDIISVPSHQRKAFSVPLRVSDLTLLIALVAVAGAVAVRRLQVTRGVSASTLAGAVARLAAGVAIWIGVAQSHTFSLAIALAWVAAVPSSRDDGAASTRFVRVMIPSLAVTEALVAYPSPGRRRNSGRSCS